jgi:hypothetical protein
MYNFFYPFISNGKLVIDYPDYLARRLGALLLAVCALMFSPLPANAETGLIKRNY